VRSREAINASERAFWDAHAAGMHPSRMPPKPPDGFELSILNALGPLEGLRVLEAGCGAGDITLELLRRGAHVTALDLSPELVEITRARIERWAPEGSADVRVAPLEATGLDDGSFDRACGKWILHHTDVVATGRELARVLAPGGRAVFFENHDRNPVLRFARRHLMTLPGVDRVGTLDERPMSEEDFDALRREFADVEFAYPSIYLFELMSRQLLRHRFVRQLAALDTWLWWRVPRLRPYGYHVLVLLTR
jgi:SAM-dependent methyltransferase